jgi:hypothetical protein
MAAPTGIPSLGSREGMESGCGKRQSDQ